VAGEPLIIPLRLEKGATLVTRVFQDSVLVSVDTMEVEKRRTEIEIIPLPGENRVELEMIDGDGNIHRKTFTVTGTEPVPVVPRKELETEDEAVPKDEADAAVLQPAAAGPVVLLITELQEESEGALQETLTELDPVEEGISTPREVFEHLYEQADEGDFSKEEVDLLLANTISQGDTELLYLQLLENSEGPLREYLEGLDLEKEGINTPEELIRHLEEVAEANGFTMDDVREAMTSALDHPLEVDRIYKELLETSDGAIKEILDGINLRRDGIYTVEELITTIYNALVERGYSSREIEKILTEMFPTHTDFIEDLVRSGDGDRKGVPLAIGGGIIALLLILIILWRRRRKNEEEGLSSDQ
jgi:hypothetical protein